MAHNRKGHHRVNIRTLTHLAEKLRDGQVPLELFLNNNRESLQQLKTFLERERRMLIAKRDVLMYGNMACPVAKEPAADTGGQKQLPDSASDAATESDTDSDATVRSF
jgi:hypothetical protein